MNPPTERHNKGRVTTVSAHTQTLVITPGGRKQQPQRNVHQVLRQSQTDTCALTLSHICKSARGGDEAFQRGYLRGTWSAAIGSFSVYHCRRKTAPAQLRPPSCCGTEAPPPRCTTTETSIITSFRERWSSWLKHVRKEYLHLETSHELFWPQPPTVVVHLEGKWNSRFNDSHFFIFRLSWKAEFTVSRPSDFLCAPVPQQRSLLLCKLCLKCTIISSWSSSSAVQCKCAVF